MSKAAGSVSAVELPDVGTSVYLLLDTRSLRTRLDSVDGDTFSVAAPEFDDRPAVDLGQELDVFWAVPRNRVVLPCRLTEISDQAPLRWTLTPTAAARPGSRRMFARGGATATVKLHTEASSTPVEAALIDISQGGLRCWIDMPLSVALDDRIRVTVWLGTREEELNTVVHTVRELPQGDPGKHLVLTFEAEDDTARLIQQYVVAWEIGERRRKG